MNTLSLVLHSTLFLLLLSPLNLSTNFSPSSLSIEVSTQKSKLEVLHNKETPAPVQKRAVKKKKKKRIQKNTKKHPNKNLNFQKTKGIIYLVIGGIFLFLAIAFFILSFPASAWSMSIFTFIIISSISGLIGTIFTLLGIGTLKKAPKREAFLKERTGKDYDALKAEVPQVKKTAVRKYIKLHLKLEDLRVEAERWENIIKERKARGEAVEIATSRLKPILAEVKALAQQIETLRKSS